jgi:hypothetical protein
MPGRQAGRQWQQHRVGHGCLGGRLGSLAAGLPSSRAAKLAGQQASCHCLPLPATACRCLPACLQIIIVDEFTGRTMPGRRWSDGLHQVRFERQLRLAPIKCRPCQAPKPADPNFSGCHSTLLLCVY